MDGGSAGEDQNKRISLVSGEHVFQWWDCIFRHAPMVASPEHFIEVRKIGTISGNIFNESIHCQPWLEEADTDLTAVNFISSRVFHAAQSGVGVFMSPSILSDRRATDESVKYLLAVTLDLDTGDTFSKLDVVVKELGLKPTLIVASGGTTELGQPKLHIHFRLSEPCDEPWKVAHVREVLASKCGGDGSFKRIPQVVRIPGSVHEKNPAYPRPVQILNAEPDQEYDLSDFCEVLGIDFNNIPPEFFWSDEKQGVSKTGEFIGKDPEAQKDRLKQITGTVIEAGGDEKDSRWQRFTEYAGRMVMHARLGEVSLEEAYQTVYGWTQTNMSPPWPDQRISQEFGALVKLDKNKNPDAWAALEPREVKTKTASSQEDWSVRNFVARRQFVGKPKPIPYIVSEFLIENTVHALVADGGVGKTYMALDLALRMAIGPSENFLGFPIKQKAAVVVLTVEDTKDDIHRRLYNMDPNGDLIAKAEDRLYIIPVREEIRGGLTLVEKDQRGNHKPSKAWEFLVEKFATVKEDHPDIPMVVIIDTYSATHHADENTSVGTNEWFRAASLLQAEYEAAILVTHHIRKTDAAVEIKTVGDFRGLVRGSGAFTANCRAVFGVWEMPNQKQLKKDAMAEDEAVLFNLGLVKANVGIDWSHRSNPKYPEPIVTLRRRGDGALIYDASIHEARLNSGAKAKARRDGAEVQLKAAVQKAIELYSEAGHPLTGKNLTRELREYLPPEVHAVPNARQAIEDYLADAARTRKLVKVSVKIRGRSFDVYDTPVGRYALGDITEKDPAPVYINWEHYVYDEPSRSYVQKS